MAGATITVVKTVPQLGKNLIYFTCTLDGSADADFSDYTAVEWISVCDVTTLAPEPATAYTAGGDITFTNADNIVAGVAVVTL